MKNSSTAATSSTKMLLCVAVAVLTNASSMVHHLAAQSPAALPAGFIEVTPGDVRWEARVGGGHTSVLIGDPSKPGLLVLRARMPANLRLMAHAHPEARTYTVLTGEWKLGFGKQFDATRLRSYPAGSVFRLPAGVPHFQATGSSETVIQIESIGPTATEYLEAKNER